MEQVKSADGTTIAYERFGSGAPVILVGGALCDRTSNRPLAAQLGSDGLTGVTYDRRGRGSSGDAKDHAPEREIEDLHALIGALGEPVALYGHSSGAALALRAAAGGASITHLVLHEAPFNLDEPAAKALSQAYHEELLALIEQDRRDEAVQHFLRTVGAPETAILGMRAEPWWAGMVALAPTLLHDSEVMGDRDGATVPRDILGSVAVPTLVVYGDASPPWMLDIATQLVAGLPDATLTILKGEEHVVAPEILAPVLRDFASPRCPAMEAGASGVGSSATTSRVPAVEA